MTCPRRSRSSTIKAGDHDISVAGGLILPDDGAAAAGGPAQVADAEPGIWVSKDKNQNGTYQQLTNSYYYSDENGIIHLDNLDTGEVTDLHTCLGLDLKNSASQVLARNIHLHDFQGDGIKGAKFEIWVSKDKNQNGTYQQLTNSYYYSDRVTVWGVVSRI